HNRVAVVAALLELGADANAHVKRSRAPLRVSADAGFTKIVTLLLENGADIEARSDAVPRLTALHFAALKGHRDTVAALLGRGASVDASTTHLWTPLHYAARHGHEGVVVELLSRGASVHARSADG
ncbi:hypothetical protein PybrP1_013049, partial [[Pythium] brassicae (nom. inval.)]